MSKSSSTNMEKMFDDLKREILKIDPVSFASNYLTLDAKPVDLSRESGWSWITDVYRYIATTATGPEGKPVVCVKGRQAGATIMACFLEMYFCTSDLYGVSPEKPPIRIMHCFPSLALVQKYAKDKLSTIMRTSVDDYIAKHSLSFDEDTGRRRVDVPDDTLTEKQFKHENKLWVDSNANDAQRMQGMSLDAIFYDEVQKMNQDDIGNSRRTLTAARYGPAGKGIQLYFGTPLRRGSHFHKMWEASNKQFYHLKCIDCHQYFKLYEIGSDSWNEIWLYRFVIKCPHCNCEQNKTQAVAGGKWIASRPTMPDGTKPQFIGFHFNQLLIPYLPKEAIIEEHPDVHPTNTERIWKNEILGEFYSGSDLPMSEDEIHEHCRDINRSISFGFKDPIANRPNMIAEYHPPAFMGIDWGGKADDGGSSKAGKSFSSIVIITVDNKGVVNIENAFKLKKNDFRHKLDVVDEMHRRYNLKLTVADLGYGGDIVPEMQREYGDRLLGCISSGNLNNPVKYDKDELRMIVNHHVILEEIFTNMRKGKIMFPWKSYDMIHWLIEHCCSMEKEERTHQGRIITKYVKGTGPNDGLMSLLYSILASKFYLTKGFKIKAHQMGKKSSGPILAYLPNM